MPSTLTTAISIFLSTPSVRRATVPPASSSAGGTISIHALREEGDLCSYSIWHSHTVISIHALREEGDLPVSFPVADWGYFYPRPP